jgi:hypothetical protein
MSVPPCEQLPEAFWLDHDLPRAEFESRLTSVDTAAGGWIRVAACKDCGQIWRIDLPHKYQVDLAIKARDAASWEADEDRAVRLEYLRRSFGGESTDSCVWAGCSRRALRGIAMCAEHAYDRAGVRAKGA